MKLSQWFIIVFFHVFYIHVCWSQSLPKWFKKVPTGDYYYFKGMGSSANMAEARTGAIEDALSLLAFKEYVIVDGKITNITTETILVGFENDASKLMDSTRKEIQVHGKSKIILGLEIEEEDKYYDRIKHIYYYYVLLKIPKDPSAQPPMPPRYGTLTGEVKFDCSNLGIGDDSALRLLVDADGTFLSGATIVEGSYSAPNFTISPNAFQDTCYYTLVSTS